MSKDERITIAISTTDKERLEIAAERWGLNMSSFIRMAIHNLLPQFENATTLSEAIGQVEVESA